MAISRSVLPFLVLLLFTVNMADSLTFIETSCSATSYPELCVESLSPYAITIQQSRFQMGLTAMTVSLAHGQLAKSFLDSLTGSLTAQCPELVEEIVDEVGETVVSLTTAGGASTTKLESLISEPLRGIDRCSERSKLDTNTEDLVWAQVTNLAQVTSNAVVLVNNI